MSIPERPIVTSSQIRAARAMLRWSAETLANNAEVSLPTIQRIESVEGLPAGRNTTLFQIVKVLETAGIQFIGGPNDAPGVRLQNKAD